MSQLCFVPRSTFLTWNLAQYQTFGSDAGRPSSSVSDDCRRAYGAFGQLLK